MVLAIWFRLIVHIMTPMAEIYPNLEVTMKWKDNLKNNLWNTFQYGKRKVTGSILKALVGNEIKKPLDKI